MKNKTNNLTKLKEDLVMVLPISENKVLNYIESKIKKKKAKSFRTSLETLEELAVLFSKAKKVGLQIAFVSDSKSGVKENKTKVKVKEKLKVKSQSSEKKSAGKPSVKKNKFAFSFEDRLAIEKLILHYLSTNGTGSAPAIALYVRKNGFPKFTVVMANSKLWSMYDQRKIEKIKVGLYCHK